MRKWNCFVLALVFALLFTGSAAQGCIGRILMIGALDSADEKVLSEILAVMINERTGTSVTIEYFDSRKELYDAVKSGDVSIIVENTDRALQQATDVVKSAGDIVYPQLKEKFRKDMDLVWLDPFGYAPEQDTGGRLYFGPVITVEVLTDFPALPRVINKLSGILEDSGYPAVLGDVKGGKKAKRAAKDFLKKKKLI